MEGAKQTMAVGPVASQVAIKLLGANGSMGSNLGPTDKALVHRVKAEVARLQQQNGSANVPIEPVTTSGSGLDPHISPEATFLQVVRWRRRETSRKTGFANP